MAQRRGILKAILGGIAALMAIPISGSKSTAAEGGTESAALDSFSVQNQDSTSLQSADSSDVPKDGSRTVEIPLSSVEELRTVGESKTLEIDGTRILVVRDAEDSVRAFQSHCTHKQVAVKYDEKKKLVRCPAHGSRFDLEGNVLRGPAKKPLRTFPARLLDDRIVLTLND